MPASCTAQYQKLKQKRKELKVKIKMDTGYAQKKRCRAETKESVRGEEKEV